MIIPIPTTPPSKNMATAILNNWRDFLPLKVAIYTKLINKDWDEFTINITTCIIK